MDLPQHCSSPDGPEPSSLIWSVIGRPLNGVEGYEHGAHAKRYLRRCAERTGIRVEAPERNEVGLAAMRTAGYTDWTNFCRRLSAWHGLYRPIPRRYAAQIGVTDAELLAAVADDREAFRRALDGPFHLETFTLRRLAGVYEVRRFPPECQDQHACLLHAMELCADTGRRVCVHVPGLKTLWFEPPHGLFDVVYYEPQVRFTPTRIVFADAGRDEGRRRLA